MTEKQLKALGFEKIKVSAEQSGDVAFYYYTLDICDISLISNDNLMSQNKWAVYLFNHNSLEITNVDTLRQFIDIIKHNQSGK